MFALSACGCGASALDDALTVATAWPAAERARWEEHVRKAAAAPAAVRWLVLAPGDDVAHVASRREPPDLILGGSAAVYEGLARRGRLEPDEAGKPAWRIARRAALGYVVRGTDRLDAELPRGVTFDDPRLDPVSLAWAKAVLGAGNWAEGYARLVLASRGPRPPGRQPGAAVAAVEGGAGGAAPAVAPFEAGSATAHAPTRFEPVAGWPEWTEGVAVVRGAERAAAAQAILDEWTRAGTVQAPEPSETASPDADALLADLLGATLVEAGDELRDGLAALEGAGWPERMRRWMTQAPPWPPASVAKLLQKPEGAALPLLETLAAQLAPEAAARAWLVRSWYAPPRLVDGPWLNELAGAVDGRLAREPRFRAWLRAEWTAWARQRYRRVARQVRAVQGGAAR